MPSLTNLCDNKPSVTNSIFRFLLLCALSIEKMLIFCLEYDFKGNFYSVFFGNFMSHFLWLSLFTIFWWHGEMEVNTVGMISQRKKKLYISPLFENNLILCFLLFYNSFFNYRIRAIFFNILLYFQGLFLKNYCSYSTCAMNNLSWFVTTLLLVIK